MLIRTIAAIVAVALITGCSSAGRVLPTAPPLPDASQLGAATERNDVRALVRIRIPRRIRRHAVAHPSTISPLTHSVSIAVNSAAAQTFNTTPSSPGCTIGTKGTTCTFAVRAAPGTDTFTVTTYSGVNASGSALDRGVAAGVRISRGKANHIAVTLGPVVTTTADSGMGSLRYAIGSANSGDTILFLLPKHSTIALASPIVIQGNVNVAGPGETLVSISGGGTHQLFHVIGTAAISGLTLKNGKAAVPNEPGGAVYNTGTLSLVKDLVASSTSVVAALGRAPRRAPALRPYRLHPHCTNVYSEGGGVYNDGTLTTSSTAFTNNVIQSDVTNCIIARGGAVYNDFGGTLSSTGDTYSGNSASQGGAVFNASLDAATFTQDGFTGNTGCTTASGCPTSGCTATSCTSFASGAGAAIFDDGAGITVTRSTFSGNVVGGKTAASQGAGGAIYLNSTLPTITGSTFSGNVAGGGSSSCSFGQGGAIYANFPLQLDDDTFKSNSATGDHTSSGGAVYGVLSIEGSGDTFTSNTAAATGGACTTSGVGIAGAAGSNTTATFDNSIFTGNSVRGNSGAAGAAITAATSAIVTGCTFTSNTAVATGAFGATSVEAAGGAIFASNLLKVSGSTFTSNSATLQGPNPDEASGGAVAVNSGTILSSNNTYKSNTVTETAGTQNAAGGAISTIAGEVVSSGDTLTSNTARSSGAAMGGAIYSDTSAQISNAAISGNKAIGPAALGGGVAIASAGSSTVEHSAIIANTANGSTAGLGGGLLDASGADISNSSISQNTATSGGAGIYGEGAAETVAESIVSGNVVTTATIPLSGGGGLTETSGVTLENSTVRDNVVTLGGSGSGGGGILSYGGTSMISTTISGNTLRGTSTNGDGGGGLLIASGIIAVNSTISNNKSSMDGGGLFNAGGGTALLENATLYDNTAAGKGGNLANFETITLINSVVGDGHAGSGRDVYNAPAGTLTSDGYDIFGTAFAGGGTYNAGTGDKFANPKLLSLANNGGPTFTNADQTTSPGRAYIPFSGINCGNITEPTDQRGFVRGAGGKCDAGAYEYAGVATAMGHPALPKMRFRHHAPRFDVRMHSLRMPLPEPSR